MSISLMTQEEQKKTLFELVTSYNNRKHNPNTSRLSQRVYNYVVGNITNANFKPSTKLVERDLANQLNISHVPVREALEKLEQHGWIYRIPRRGAFVTKFNLERLKSVYQIREIIETGAAYITAQQIDREGLAELKKSADLLESANNTKDAEIFKAADAQFHRLIVHFTGNQGLEEYFDSIILQANSRFFTMFWTDATDIFIRTGKRANYVDPSSHTHIYNAFAAHNADLAEQLVRKHIRHSCTVLSKIIKLHEELAELGE